MQIFPVESRWLDKFTEAITDTTPANHTVRFWDGSSVIERALTKASFSELFQESGDFILRTDPVSGEQKRADRCVPIDQRHVVLPISNGEAQPLAFAKFLPDMPGIEIAVSSLHYYITGQGAPMATLACFSAGTGQQAKNYPVLLTQAVPGVGLDRYLKSPVAHENPVQFEPVTFSNQIFMAMLTIPMDAKPSNYIVNTRAVKGKEYQCIVAIDNEISFAKPTERIRTRRGTSVKLNLFSILFCLPQMSNRIDPQALRRWRDCDANKIINQWLAYLNAFNEAVFLGKAPLFNREACDHWCQKKNSTQLQILPILIIPELIKTLYASLLHLQRILRHPMAESLTHLDILDELYPYVCEFYRRVNNDKTLSLFSRYTRLALQCENIEVETVVDAIAEGVRQSPNVRHISLVTADHWIENWKASVPAKRKTPNMMAIFANFQRNFEKTKNVLKEYSEKESEISVLQRDINCPRTQNGVLMKLLAWKKSHPELVEAILVRRETHFVSEQSGSINSTGREGGEAELKIDQTPIVDFSQYNQETQAILLKLFDGLVLRRLFLINVFWLTSKRFRKIISQLPELEWLDVRGCTQLTEQDIQFVGLKCRLMRQLNLSSLHLTRLELTDKVFYRRAMFYGRNIGEFFPVLEQLWLDYNVYLTSFNLQLASLRMLSLISCVNLEPSERRLTAPPNVVIKSDAAVAGVAAFKSELLPRIVRNDFGEKFKEWLAGKEVCIVINSLAQYQMVAAILRQNRPNIGILSIVYDKGFFSSDSGDVLIDALRYNNTLTSLQLEKVILAERSWLALAGLLKTNYVLKSLTITGCTLTHNACCAIIGAFEINQTVTHLKLANIGLNNDCIPVIAKILVTNSSLQFLDISKNNLYLHHPSMPVLARALQKNRTLNTLDISDTKDKYDNINPCDEVGEYWDSHKGIDVLKQVVMQRRSLKIYITYNMLVIKEEWRDASWDDNAGGDSWSDECLVKIRLIKRKKMLLE